MSLQLWSEWTCLPTVKMSITQMFQFISTAVRTDYWNFVWIINQSIIIAGSYCTVPRKNIWVFNNKISTIFASLCSPTQISILIFIILAQIPMVSDRRLSSSNLVRMYSSKEVVPKWTRSFVLVSARSSTTEDLNLLEGYLR